MHTRAKIPHRMKPAISTYVEYCLIDGVKRYSANLLEVIESTVWHNGSCNVST